MRGEKGQDRGVEIEEWREEERRRNRDANDIHTVIAIRELE